MSRSVLRALVAAASLLTIALLASCADGPIAVAVTPLPVLPPAPVPMMPAGGVPGMIIPARLADGGYPTPSRGPQSGALSTDAALWHLRAALNVAALVCRGAGDPLATGYNAMLTARRAALATAEAHYAAEWKTSGIADWRDGYDDAMTRLYNFYGQSFARTGFCAAAQTTLMDMAAVTDADLPGFAPAHMAMLDRPFTDFFAAYDLWRGGVMPQRPVIALAAPANVPESAPIKPRLEVDPAIFRL